MSKSRLIIFPLVSILAVSAAIIIFSFQQEPNNYSSNSSCGKNFHYSYFSSRSFFDKAYKQAASADIQLVKAKGILVNHHLLAAHLIAQTIKTIATIEPTTLVLISPNHFSAGRGQIISSLYNWQTPYGVLDSNCEAIAKLAKQGIIRIDESPFKTEHGISGIVSFIKKSLPNARLVPIIVKNTVSQDELDKFVQSLYAILGDNTLIIGSFDFSHDATDAVAKIRDANSLSVIKNFDYVGMQDMSIDSIPGLEIVMKYLEKEGAKHFDLIANTNSAQLLKKLTITNATSYINGVFSIK